MQHYYRDTFIEIHRKPIDVPEMLSYSGRLTYQRPMEEYFINLTTKSPFRNSQGFLVSSLSTQHSALKKFFLEKDTHAEILVNTTLPAYGICHITLQNLKYSAQKH